MQTIFPYLLYDDASAAMDFLARAFGFEETMRMARPDGSIGHAQMKLGDEEVMLGQPESKPDGSANRVVIYVYVGDVEAHYERARAAGAEIRAEPADQEYGVRDYNARDPEGHSWYFAQRLEA